MPRPPADEREPDGERAAPPDPAVQARARIARYLMFLGCPQQVLDDLTQDTMLAAARHFRAAAAPLPWLLTTARNLLRQHFRARGWRPLDERLDELHDRYCEQMLDDGGDRQLDALRECLRALPERSRRVVEMRYGDGRSRQAIADAIGIGVEGVKSLLASVRERLGECIRRRIADD